MNIKPLGHYAMENHPSVYDEESLTALQLCARIAGKVNEVVNAMNTFADETGKTIVGEVDKWLEEHPEVTTTVMDGSIGEEKIMPDFRMSITNNYVTPAMFGASLDKTPADNATALRSAMEYANTHKCKVYIDKAYTFSNIDFSGLYRITLEGPGKGFDINVTGANGVGIYMPTTHHTLTNISFKTTADITLLSVPGRYNIFNNVHLWGANNNTGVGADIGGWCNTFTDSSIRSFNECAVVEGNFITFVNCVLVGADTAEGSNVTVNSGFNIAFNTCDIEKGNGLLTVNDGVVTVAKCYCEGGQDPHFKLYGGVVMADANYLHNTIIHKYGDCSLTLTNNLLEFSLSEVYCLICKSENIGFLVAENNHYLNDNGIFTRVTRSIPGGPSVPQLYYQDASGNWQTGTMDKYYRINQEKCQSVEDKGAVTISISARDQRTSGVTANRDYYGAKYYTGSTWYDTTEKELYTKTTDGWHRAGSVWANGAALPSSPVKGQVYFYNGKPVWYNGTNWVDANGTQV